MVSANIKTTNSYFSGVMERGRKVGNTSVQDFTEIMRDSQSASSETDTDNNVSKSYGAKASKEDSTFTNEADNDSQKVHDAMNEFKNKVKNSKDALPDEDIENVQSVVPCIDMLDIQTVNLDEIKSQIADVLGISMEELDKYLSDLDFKIEDLMVPDNIVKLVMMSQNVDNPALLLTNSGILEKINNITDILEAGSMKLSFEQTEEVPHEKLDANDVIQHSDLESTDENSETSNYELSGEGSSSFEISGKTISEKLNEMSQNSDNKNTSSGEKHDNNAESINISNVNINNIAEDIADAIAEKTSDIGEARIISQIIEQVRVNAKPDMSSMELQLYPEHLGKVSIQVIAKDGGITAQIAAENESVVKAIESQLSLLKDSLNNQGIKVEAVEVTVASHSFEENLDDSGRKKDESGRKHSYVRRSLLEELNGEDFFNEITEEEKMEVIGNTVSYMA
ncbi:MAG: flagellar hook-length control protein FliK [Lachnospiraceae bacterium]|nr:flagellar hook-length control protein FliK [Lachnospiraceae bacterium]